MKDFFEEIKRSVSDFRKINGIAYREDGEIKINGSPETVEDLDANADQTVYGESYIDTGDIRFDFDGETSGPFTEGEIIMGSNGETGVLTSFLDNDPTGTMVLRDVRGTFENDLSVSGVSSGASAVVNGSVTTILQAKTSPFGTFAGGIFFGARGVWIEDIDPADANNYQLIDSLGESHSPPLSVPISITAKDTNNSAIENALIYVQKQLDSSDYGHPGNPYTDPGSSTNQRGNSAYVVSEAIESDTPSSGWLKVQDISTQEEHAYRYASWSSSTFTFNTEVTGTDNGTGDSTTINETNIGTKDIAVGDTIRMSNSPYNWALVLSVSTNSVTTTELSGGDSWASEPYSVHTLAVDYVTGDYSSVPLILDYTNVSGVAGLSYSYDIDKDIDIYVRKSTPGSTRYRPLKTVGSITNSGFSTTVVMTVDTIASN